MEIIETPFKGLLLLRTPVFEDARGCFQKLFNADFFRENALACDFKELYYSVNGKNVLRGMHFQEPPYDLTKVVYVSVGRILDVVVDLRKDSETCGKCFSIELDDRKGEFLYIPSGFAHGFLSLEDGTVVNYAQTACYSREHDCGIDALSIPFDWGVDAPVRSGRDLTFESLDRYSSPF